MRLLLLNPNTSPALTGRMAETAQRAVPPGVVVRAITAARGFPYISNRAEAQVAGAIVMETLAQEAEGVDAAIIGAFGDPGLRAARDLFPFPVIGVAEAAVLSASMLGRRFGIVGFTTRMRDWYQDCIFEIGMERRFAGFRAPDTAPQGAATAQEDLHDDLLACIRDCRERDAADVVIMAGAPLAGFAATVKDETAAPLIDPVSAAVQQAVAMARLTADGALARRRWGDPKVTSGLDPSLAARFLGAAQPPAPPAHNCHAPAVATPR